MSELVRQASQQAAELARQEVRLAQLEMAAKGRRFGMAAGLLGGGGLVAFYGGAVLIAAAVLGLAEAVDPWLAALIVGAVLLVIAAALALVGRKEAAEALPPRPEEAAASVHEDIEVIKERTGR